MKYDQNYSFSGYTFLLTRSILYKNYIKSKDLNNIYKS